MVKKHLKGEGKEHPPHTQYSGIWSRRDACTHCRCRRTYPGPGYGVRIACKERSTWRGGGTRTRSAFPWPSWGRRPARPSDRSSPGGRDLRPSRCAHASTWWQRTPVEVERHNAGYWQANVPISTECTWHLCFEANSTSRNLLITFVITYWSQLWWNYIFLFNFYKLNWKPKKGNIKCTDFVRVWWNKPLVHVVKSHRFEHLTKGTWTTHIAEA